MDIATLYSFIELAGGLALLIFGSELLVRGAARIARMLGISSFIVGLTVVAFGTSAPELGGSLRAAFDGKPELAVGNVVGSNIANVCLILGAAAVICPIPVKLAAVRKEALIMIAATAAALVAMIGGGMHRVEGALLVAGLITFTVRAYREGRRTGTEEEETELAKAAHELEQELATDSAPRPLLSIFLVLSGLGMLYFGSGWLVSGAESIAIMLGVSTGIVGLSLVAFGTSVPELVLSIVAALRKQPDIAIGNILGSNIFNILSVLGITALLSPEMLPANDLFWQRDAWVMLAVAVACLPIMGSGRRVSRFEGAVLLGLYAVYLGTLFVMGDGAPAAAAAQ